MYCRDFNDWVLPFIAAGLQYWISRQYSDWQNKYRSWFAIEVKREKGAVVIISGDYRMSVGSVVEYEIGFYAS
ncbi:MAG: hypothetical protein F6K40_38240 [Okeania sp. SIO3I5]|uniref:hypothetical protein n=1 Tax=Okeania sp. SIO3I5 TaxID=2607805 RepID=UPI0013BD183F|nr:hypothetical protein [Okeania sp. SIO3I5]NEQ41716.1 hypothetical protein [Okeania sp. SIO3I5]